MSELDEIVVLLSVDRYKSLLDLENERKEFEEMEKLVREKEREKREFEEYKKAGMEKEKEKILNAISEILIQDFDNQRREFEEYKKAEKEKLSIELKKEKEAFVDDVSLELYKYENKPAERIPEEILKRFVNDIDYQAIVPSTDDLYPVLYFKSHIQSPGCPTDLYLHTFYFNTGAQLTINGSINNNWKNVSMLGHSSKSTPYLCDLNGQTVIDSLKQYKDKYIFTQNMVDIIYKTFDGDKTKFILSKYYLRRDEYRACPNQYDVNRLIDTLKVLQQERKEYTLNLRTLI
jgi:hypothetical protein